MMERMLARIAAALAIIVATTGTGGAAGAQDRAASLPPAPMATAAAALVPAPAAPLPADAETALGLGNLDTRMTVPVSIGSQGPWGFVIDTGAERTVVSRQLAGRLGLAAGPDLRVIAMTGAEIVPSVVIPALSVSSVPPTSVTAPAFEERNLGAPGMLGIDALQGHRVEIDFDAAAMRLKPSRKRYVAASSHGDEVVVVARSMFGQLIVTDARWRGRRIAVVLDTGSSMTVGNPALLAMMQTHSHHLGPATAVSVTGASLATDVFVADDLTIGSIGLDRVPIAFADAAPFHRFGLVQRPALMLGMDTLRMFRRVRIDFANRAIEFVLPRRDGVAIGPAA